MRYTLIKKPITTCPCGKIIPRFYFNRGGRRRTYVICPHCNKNKVKINNEEVKRPSTKPVMVNVEII